MGEGGVIEQSIYRFQQLDFLEIDLESGSVDFDGRYRAHGLELVLRVRCLFFGLVLHGDDDDCDNNNSSDDS